MRSAGGPSVQVQYAATARSSLHVEPLVEPPGGVLGREVEGARGDVDVGDLHRDRLELGERPAELGPALDVVRGEVARAGDDAGRGQAEAGDVPLGQRLRGTVAKELGLGAVEDDGVRRDPRRRSRTRAG